jgi:ankyrin repeat protein
MVNLLDVLVTELGCPVDPCDLYSFTPLHSAANGGQVGAIRKLVQLGHPVDCRDYLGKAPLHYAAMHGRVAALKELAAEGALLEAMSDISDDNNQVPYTPLHCAADAGQVEAVKVLVEELGVPVDFLTGPIWKDVDCTDIRDKHISINPTTGGVESTPRKKKAKKSEEKDTTTCSSSSARSLSSPAAAAAAAPPLSPPSPPRPSNRVSSLSLALRRGAPHMETIVTLVELGASVNLALANGGEHLPYIESPLHMASRLGKMDAVIRLLKCSQIDVKCQIKDGSTALHYAAACGQTAVVKTLVDQGKCPVDIRDNANNTPLHLAAGCGYVETVTMLLRLGADINAKDITDCTPLQNAAHGTYSAMAASSSSSAVGSIMLGGGHLPGPPSSPNMKGYARFNSPKQPYMTPTQLAAQAALTAGSSNATAAAAALSLTSPTRSSASDMSHHHHHHQYQHIMPVRTGLSWSLPKDGDDDIMTTMDGNYNGGGGAIATTTTTTTTTGGGNKQGSKYDKTVYHIAHRNIPDGSTKATLNASTLAVDGQGNLLPNADKYAKNCSVDVTDAVQSGAFDPDAFIKSKAVTGNVMVHSQRPPPHLARGGGSGGEAAAAAPSSSSAAALSTTVTTNAPFAAKEDGASTTALVPTAQYDSGQGVRVGSGTDLWTTWEKLGLTQLVKKAYKQQLSQQKDHTSKKGLTAAEDMALYGGGERGGGKWDAHGTGGGGMKGSALQEMHECLQQMQFALAQSQNKLQQHLLSQNAGGASFSSDSNNGVLAAGEQLQLDWPFVEPGATTAAATANDKLFNPALSLGKDGSHSAVTAALTHGSITTNVFGSPVNLGGEQDRSRLIPVIELLASKGAKLTATDTEGRTALHLAAGCGDKHMAVKLIELGTDVNCKDSVGGTAMHHAAMANKKDMMFALAKLGCDWRSRAKGIDGATASYVLCGQHGKSSPQQKLLDAKLKKLYQEGAASRAAGKDPMVDMRNKYLHQHQLLQQQQQTRGGRNMNSADNKYGGEGPSSNSTSGGMNETTCISSTSMPAFVGNFETEKALADAAMAALLEEEEAEAAKKDGQKKAKKKKGKKPRTSIHPEACGQSSQLPAKSVTQDEDEGEEEEEEEDTEEPNTPVSQKSIPRIATNKSSSSGSQSPSHISINVNVNALSSSRGITTTGGHNVAERIEAEDSKRSMASSHDDGGQALSNPAKTALDTAADEASKLLSTTSTGRDTAAENVDEDAMEAALNDLDNAIECAMYAGVGAKYGKKIRKKLQTALDRARGVLPPEEERSPSPEFLPPSSRNNKKNTIAAAVGKTQHQQQSGNKKTAKVVVSSAPPPPPPRHHQQQQQQGPRRPSSSASSSGATVKFGDAPAMLPPTSRHPHPPGFSGTTTAPPPPPPPGGGGRGLLAWQSIARGVVPQGSAQARLLPPGEGVGSGDCPPPCLPACLPAHPALVACPLQLTTAAGCASR